ncbi:MAG TPA: SDR family oxidoreductase [Acidobacteriaceae bacterium]|nr:SDR family oxidoreductase [Acidobacteriaceae bacterium]
MSKLQGKVALITGANRGIGLETAKQLGKLGATVFVAARQLSKAELACEVLRGQGVDARPMQLDVVSELDRDAAVKTIGREFGRLDILINNAGVLLDPRSHNATSTTPLSMLRETFEINFFAAVALTQALLPLLRKSAAGRIVNLSSILASLTYHATEGSPVYHSKTFAYDASKAALNSFTIHLAHELRNTNIKVNSAHPGWVKTEMGGEGAHMEIIDGAKTSVQLATLGADGPSGGYFHMGQPLPW